MGEVMNVCEKTHQTNTRRIARRVLGIIGLTACGRELVLAGQKPNSLNNWSVVVFIINHLFPVPLLAKVTTTSIIEDVVIEVLITEGMLRKSPSPHLHQIPCDYGCTRRIYN